MQFRVIVVTDPQTNKPTNRQDRLLLQYNAPLSLARSVIIVIVNQHHPYVQHVQTIYLP